MEKKRKKHSLPESSHSLPSHAPHQKKHRRIASSARGSPRCRIVSSAPSPHLDLSPHGGSPPSRCSTHTAVSSSVRQPAGLAASAAPSTRASSPLPLPQRLHHADAQLWWRADAQSASSSPPPPRRKTTRDRRRPLRPCRDSGGCKQQLRAPAKRLKPLGKIFRRVRLTATKGDPASLDENNGTSPESSPKSPRDQQFQLHH